MFTPGFQLNRSCSESDLTKVNFDNLHLQDDKSENSNYFITKRVFVVEEIISSDFPNAITRGSSSQITGRSIPDRLHNLDKLTFCRSVVNNKLLDNSFDHFINNEFNQFSDMKNNSVYLKNEDVIPMEVDVLHEMSKKSDGLVEIMEMDIDDQNVAKLNTRCSSLKNVIKKRNPSQTSRSTNLMNFIQEGKSKENRSKITPVVDNKKRELRCNTYIVILLAAVICTLLYFVFLYDSLYVNTDVQNHDLEKDLTENVLGQNDSLRTILRSFKQRQQWKRKIKVLSFVGSAGVGKTFVANVIKRHFLRELTNELFGMHLNYVSERNRVLNALRSCCLNLIIVDDLKLQDTTELFAFIHTLPENYFVLVLPIFSIQYTSNELKHVINYTDIIEIRNAFDNSGLYHELIIFKELNINGVEDWIRIKLKYKNIDLELQERILKNVLSGHDIRYRGLKGLYSKLLLELEKYGH